MRWLVASGGGAGIAFEIGVAYELAFKELSHRDGRTRAPATTDALPWRGYAGVSSGAITAAKLAGGTWEDMLRLKGAIFAIRGRSDVLSWRFGKWARFIFRDAVSFMSPKGLRRLVEREIDPERIKASGNKLIVGVTDIRSGQYYRAREDSPELKRRIIDSASIPGAFPGTTERSGAVLLDGGIVNITPLAGPIKEGATSIDLILAQSLKLGRTTANLKSIKNRLVRSFEIHSKEVFRGDLRECHLRNAGQNSDRVIDVRVYPYRNRTIGSLDFDPSKLREAFDHGRRAALAPLSMEQALEEMKG